MKVVYGLLLVFGMYSGANAQNCASGNCMNSGTPMTRVPPRNQQVPPAPNLNNQTNRPIPAPVYVNGKDGINGKDGLPGRNGKDADPQVLQAIQDNLAQISKQLNDAKATNDAIAARIANLEKNAIDLGKLQSQVTSVSSRVETLNQKLAGQLKVRFKYDPANGTLTPAN